MSMHNVFQAWSFMERIQQRRICFKGDGPQEIPETEAQRASAEIAMKNYNDYITTIKPFEEKFVADVAAPVESREAKVAGKVNADIAQKVGLTRIDPNKGQAPGTVAAVANTLSDAELKGNQAVNTQKATGLQALIDMGMGKNTQAQLGLSSLAGDAASEAASNTANQQYVSDASKLAAASGLGTAAFMAKNLYDNNK